MFSYETASSVRSGEPARGYLSPGSQGLRSVTCGDGQKGNDRLFAGAGLEYRWTGGAELKVYLDIIILLNYAVDHLLLLGTARILGMDPVHKRLLAAAVFGGLYSGACFLKGLSLLGSPPGRLVSLLTISVIAFGWNMEAVKRGGVFLLLSFALGGAVQGVSDGSLLAVLLCAGGIALMCRLLWTGGMGGAAYAKLVIRYNGSSVAMDALRDTGNRLLDPVTGERVIVIGPEVARRLTGLSKAELADPVGTVASRQLPGLRLIPYSAVGNEGGLLLGMRFPDAAVDGKPKSIIAAMVSEGMGDFDALIGGWDNE